MKWALALAIGLALGLIHPAHAEPAERAPVYVVRRGWHVDVGLPVHDLTPALRQTIAGFSPRYVFFGFADRRYLTWRHHSSATLMAVWPGRGALLLTLLDNTPEQAFGPAHVLTLHPSASGLAALQTFIWRSLTDGEVPTPLQAGPYEDSLFYESTLHYSGLHTCNTWAAQALQAAGFDLKSGGTIFAGQLWRKAQRLEAAEPSVAFR